MAIEEKINCVDSFIQSKAKKKISRICSGGRVCARVWVRVCGVKRILHHRWWLCVWRRVNYLWSVHTHTHTDPTRSPIHGKIGTDLASNSIIRERERERNHRHREQSRGSSSIFLAIGRPHWSIIPQDTHLHTCVSPGVSTSLMYWTTVISSSSRAGQSRHRAECVSAGLVRVSECAFYRKQR